MITEQHTLKNVTRAIHKAHNKPAPLVPFPLLSEKHRQLIADACKDLYVYRGGTATPDFILYTKEGKIKQITREELRDTLRQRGLTTDRLDHRNTNSLLGYAGIYLTVYKNIVAY